MNTLFELYRREIESEKQHISFERAIKSLVGPTNRRSTKCSKYICRLDVGETPSVLDRNASDLITAIYIPLECNRLTIITTNSSGKEHIATFTNDGVHELQLVNGSMHRKITPFVPFYPVACVMFNSISVKTELPCTIYTESVLMDVPLREAMMQGNVKGIAEMLGEKHGTSQCVTFGINNDQKIDVFEMVDGYISMVRPQ